MDVWKTFKFSVDLITAALNEIAFLKEINESPIAQNEDIISRAVYRYEKIWLPFYSQHEPNTISPPLDIEWIWHCHMLSHNEYKQDCLTQYGKLLDHEVLSSKERYSKENDTYLLWSKSIEVSFNYLDSKSVGSDYGQFKSNFRIDLKETAKRQLDFYYQVSLPHFQSIEYLTLGLDRYEKFLYLKKRNPSVFIIPCYTIYLIWHAHKLTPVSFMSDTQKIFGEMFSHRDTINKIDYWIKLTKILWEKTFGEEFFFPGAMSRGYSIPRHTNVAFNDTFNELCYKYLTITVKDIKFETKTSLNSFLVKIGFNFDDNQKWLTKQWKPMLKNATSSSKSILANLENRQNKYKKLNMEISVFNEQKKLAKVLNILNHSNKANVLMSSNHQIDLSVNHKNSDIIKLENNDCKLSIKLQLKKKLKNIIYFSITNTQFSDIRMNQVKDEYRIFDLNRKMYRSNEESAVRTVHKICANLGQETQKESFELEVLHLFALKWSSIRIMANKQHVATSHLIGLEHLPGLYQLPEETYSYDQNDLCESSMGIILDNRYEKAMLVRNINGGDYAILKGKWIGKKNSVPGATGHLIVSYYLLSTKQLFKIRISKNSIFNIMSENIQAKASLKTGLIQLQHVKKVINCLEVESLLACIFSVSVLHVVLQPKLIDNKPGSIGWTNMDEYVMLSSIASYEFNTSDRFMYGLSGYDGCDSGFDCEDGTEYVGSVYGRGDC